MSQQSVTHRLESDVIPAEVVVRSPASASIGLPVAVTATCAISMSHPSLGMSAALEAAVPLPFDVRRVFWAYPAHKSPAREIRPSDAGIEADQPLGSKLQALMRVGRGWDDGVGIAPQLPALFWARDLGKQLGHHDVAGLHVTPTREGGLMVERQIGDARWSLEVDRDCAPFLVLVTRDGPTETLELESPSEAADSLRKFVATWSRARVTA